jgi:hypothetical protein
VPIHSEVSEDEAICLCDRISPVCAKNSSSRTFSELPPILRNYVAKQKVDRRFRKDSDVNWVAAVPGFIGLMPAQIPETTPPPLHAPGNIRSPFFGRIFLAFSCALFFVSF